MLRQRESKWLDMLNNWDKWMAKKHKKVSYSRVPSERWQRGTARHSGVPLGQPGVTDSLPKVCIPLDDSVGLNRLFIPLGNWSLEGLSGPMPAHFCLQLFPAGLELS